MKDFFEFADYRDFLRERYGLLKAANPKLSCRGFARKAGIASPAYFNMVVSAQRQLTLDSARKVAKGLRLPLHEQECLYATVELERATEGEGRRRLFNALTRLRKRRPRPMTADHLEILSDPANVKLYLLAQSRAFRLDASWLEKHGFTPPDAEVRIERFFKSGLWELDGERVVTKAPVLESGDRAAGLHLRGFHEALLALAARALDEPPDERVFGSRTLLVDPARLPAAKASIDKFRAAFDAEFDDPAADSVYALHVTFFAL